MDPELFIPDPNPALNFPRPGSGPNIGCPNFAFKKFCFQVKLIKTAGLGTAFFPIRYIPFFKKNVPFISVLFRVFGDLRDLKERSVFSRSFLKSGKECKERNVLMQRTEKNATFFCKQRKRTQRTQHSLAKNVKERKNISFFCKRAQNVPFFCKRAQKVPFFFQYMYIDIYIYI